MVAAQDRTKPDTGFFTDFDIADQHGGRCQEGGRMDPRRLTIERDEMGHQSLDSMLAKRSASMLPPVITSTVGPRTSTTRSTIAATHTDAAPSAMMPSYLNKARIAAGSADSSTRCISSTTSRARS